MPRQSYRIPIYGSRVFLVMADSIGEAITLLPSNLQGVVSDCDGCMVEDESGDFGVVLKTGSQKQTLFHELDHVVNAVCDYHGVEDAEARAYLAGWLGERLEKFVRKPLRKKK